ncbi:MAG: Sec-independent protein translocase protein TatB [Actinomycetota bacterium]
MPQIGPLEILIVAAIALIVFGPEKLPGIARSVGRAASELRRMATDVTDEFKSGLDDDDEPRPAKPARQAPAEKEAEDKPADAKTDSGGES